MYPHGYGNPRNLYPPEEPAHSNQHQHQYSMMQDPHTLNYQHHLQQFPPSSSFHQRPPEYNSPSFHYPPAHRPPFPPYDNPPPDAPPPPYPPSFPSFYPPQPANVSFYPPPPSHSAPYPPQLGLPHVSSSGDHSHPSSEHWDACPRFEIAHHNPFPDHSSSFPHHTSSFQENRLWISERGSVTLNEPSPSSCIVHPPVDVELPKGQIVRVFCKSSRSYNLAVRNNRLMMVEADLGNESQQWIRDDKYSIRVRDSSGHPAFMLINKASKKVLKHAKGKLQEVQLIDYSPDIQDDDLFWTESQDFGEGFKTLRMASDTLFNLTAGHGNRVEDGSSVILDTWHKKDNQLWKVFPL
eukprot:c14392_g1_i1 orf=405-1460(-)